MKPLNKRTAPILKFAAALAACLLAASDPAFAATHTWSGAVNGLFSNPGNWSAGGVPTLAETNALSFPASATRFTVTNDIGTLSVSAFNISGSNYIIRGASTFTIRPNLVNLNCQGWSNTIESPLNFAGLGTIVVGTGDSLILSGMLSGTNGIFKSSSGALYIKGTASNPLTGDLDISSGDVYFQKTGGASSYSGSSISLGSTTVTDLTHLILYADNQIPDSAAIEIQPSGVLRLNDHSDIVGPVTMTGGIIDTGAGKLTINGDLALTPRFVGLDGLNQPVFESTTLWGTIEFGGASRVISVSTNTCKIEAAIVDAGPVTVLNKTGPGTLELRGNNTFPGQFNVLEGTVFAYNFDSMGTTAGNTVVSNGATLIIPDGVTFSEPLVLSGSGQNGSGALKLDGGGNTICNGLIAVSNLARVFVPPGQQLQFTSVVSGPGGIEKTGLGDLTLAGVSANTFSGASFVNEGKMQLSKSASTRAIGSVTVTNGASLVFNNNEQMDNAGVLSVCGGASVNLTNRTETIGGLNTGAGAVLNTGTGLLTMLGDFYVGGPYNFSGETATIQGNLSLGGAMRTVSSPFQSLVLDCSVSDGAGVGGIRVHDGSLYLLRSNSFSGPVVVKGACSVSNAFALGAPGGGVILTNDPGYESSFSIRSANSSISGETLTNYSFSYFNNSGTNTWNGPIVLATTNLFVLYSGMPYQLTLNGQISGSGTIWSAGKVILSQANTYTGLTEISGTVVLKHPQALGGTGQGTLVDEGATLELDMPNGSVVLEPLFGENVFLPAPTNFTLSVIGAVTNTWAAPIAMLTNDVPWMRAHIADPAGTLRMDNGISGLGGVEKTGPGTLILGGTSPNTYQGETTVREGTLVLNKPNGVQAVGNLSVSGVGKVEWGGSDQIPNHTSLNLSSSGFGYTNVFLRSHSETVSNVTLLQSYMDVGTGTFTLLGDFDISNPSLSWENISGITGGSVLLSPGTHRIMASLGWEESYFHVSSPVHETGGSAGLRIDRSIVYLAASNSFTGPVVVDASLLTLTHPYALGSAAQGVLVTNQSRLVMLMTNNIAMPGESIVLADQAPGEIFPNKLFAGNLTTNSWGGSLILMGSNQVDVATDSKFTITGPVYGPGKLRSTGRGELVLAGTQPNTVPGIIVEEGTLHLAKLPGIPALAGDVLLNPDGLDLAPPTLVLGNSNQFPPQTVVTVGEIDSNAYFYLNGHAAAVRAIAGLGTVNVGSGTLTITNSGADGDFRGQMVGSPGGTRLIKQGTATQLLLGNNALYGGALLQGGTLGLGSSIFSQMDIAAGTRADLYGMNTTFDALTGMGSVFRQGGGAEIYIGGNNASSTFNGLIYGASLTSFIKVGTGVFTFNGTNTDAGTTLVRDGTLLVNGRMTNSVVVSPFTPGNAPTLGGTGTVGNVTVTGLGARISPGPTTASPSYGKLTVGNLTLGANANYRCEIGGTNAGVNLDQINATGTITLSGGFADFAAFGAGTLSNRYAVVKSAVPVSGTFLGDPEGDFITPAAGRLMQITYLTAGGKEVTLIDQSTTLPNTFGGITRGTNGSITLNGTGTIGVTYSVQANTNLNTTNWIVIGSSLANFNGALTFVDTNATNFAMRFYRFAQP